MIAIMIFFAIMLHSSVWGLCLRAVGSDEETAFNTEVNVTWIKTSALLITGVLSAVAGILTSMMLGAGIPSLGTGWELIAITACAIGGVSLFGYTGNMAGLFLGLFALQIIQNGIIVIGISAYIQNVVVGGILMLAMIVEVRRRRTLNLERV
jgi:ribose transport system permease protein